MRSVPDLKCVTSRVCCIQWNHYSTTTTQAKVVRVARSAVGHQVESLCPTPAPP